MLEYIPEHFKYTYFIPILKEMLKKLEADFQKNFEEYKAKFILNFKNICEIIKKEHNNLEIGYISYNLMLIKTLNNNYNYDIYIYDKNWYLNRDIKITEYDVSFIYKYFEEMWTRLLKERKAYVFKINDTDINNLMTTIIDKFHYYIVSLMRNSIVEITETEEFLNLNKANSFNIYTGKFYDKFDIIYIENKDKNIVKIKRELEKEETYINKDLRNLELNDIKFEMYDLRGTDFRNSELSNMDLSYKMLVGAKFKNAKIMNTSFESSILSETNFENANLINCKMISSFIYKGKMSELLDVGFLRVNLKNTNLINVDFSKSFLENIDFRDAILENVNFEECKFKECIFKKEQLEKLNLSEKQIKEIIIV